MSAETEVAKENTEVRCSHLFFLKRQFDLLRQVDAMSDGRMVATELCAIGLWRAAAATRQRLEVGSEISGVVEQNELVDVEVHIVVVNQKVGELAGRKEHIVVVFGRRRGVGVE